MDEEIIISFGVLYEKSNGEDRYCIIDVSGPNDRYFYDTHLQRSKREKDMFCHLGTGGPEGIGKIIGVMASARVIEAFEEGHNEGMFYDDETRRYLEECAAKPPRRLKLR